MSTPGFEKKYDFWKPAEKFFENSFGNPLTKEEFHDIIIFSEALH